MVNLLKKKIFVHQNIPYAFNWNIAHHKEKILQKNPNREEFIKLGSYFKRIYKGEIPNDLFNLQGLSRVSQFKMRGLKPAFITSFSKKLIREGKIRYLGSDSKLPNHTQNVFESFKINKIGKVPGHEPVLKNILIKDKNSVAIEVPIWKKVNNSYITGHIDLIQIEDNIVKVIDYKPEGNFMNSLPQVATYGLLIKSKFELQQIKCLSFNKTEAWEYDPVILLTDVKDYLVSHRINKRKWEDFVK